MATLFIFALSLTAVAAAPGAWDVSGEASHLEVHVPKAGIFSFAGHEHTIVADDLSGTVSVEAESDLPVSVVLEVPLETLRVADSDLDDEDREEVRATMLSDRVLDQNAAPVIRFRSVQLQRLTETEWDLSGDLEVAGRSVRLTFPVQISFPQRGRLAAEGEVELSLADFDIEPVRALGGTIRTGKKVTVRFNVIAEAPRS